MRRRKMREWCVRSPGSPTHDQASEPTPSGAQAPHTCKGPWHRDSKVRTGHSQPLNAALGRGGTGRRWAARHGTDDPLACQSLFPPVQGMNGQGRTLLALRPGAGRRARRMVQVLPRAVTQQEGQEVWRPPQPGARQYTDRVSPQPLHSPAGSAEPRSCLDLEGELESPRATRVLSADKEGTAGS